MKRRKITSLARTQATDASCINNDRGMSRRAKRQGTKRVRQYLKKELNNENI